MSGQKIKSFYAKTTFSLYKDIRKYTDEHELRIVSLSHTMDTYEMYSAIVVFEEV